MEYRFILLALGVYFVCVEDGYCSSPDDILTTARRHTDSTSWSYDGCLHGSRYCNTNKCNIFVHDVLVEAGARTPHRWTYHRISRDACVEGDPMGLAHPRDVINHWWRYSPIGANEWGDPDSSYVMDSNCYDHISSLSDKEGGDIIAFPASFGSGHVGIVSSGENYISAQRDRIEEKSINSELTTVLWRYTC